MKSLYLLNFVGRYDPIFEYPFHTSFSPSWGNNFSKNVGANTPTLINAYSSPDQWVTNEQENKSRCLVLDAAVVCDSCTAWKFVTFCEERINLKPMSFVFMSCHCFCQWPYLVIYSLSGVCGLRTFPAFCSEQMMFVSSVLGWHKKVFGLSYTVTNSLQHM